MTTAAGPRMSAKQRREQLLDVTKGIVDKRGFHAVSIEAVARAAGISRPIVYGHFGDLAGLLEALIEREAERAIAQLDAFMPEALAEGGSPERLEAGMRGYLEAVQADPATWRLVLMPPEGAPALLREQSSAAARGWSPNSPMPSGRGSGPVASRPTRSWPRSCSPRSRTRAPGCCSQTRSAFRWSASSGTPAGCWNS